MRIHHLPIIEKCKKNDRRAQLQLYNHYCDAMYNVAFRFMKNSQDAEDVMQEAFIKAFKKIDIYKGEVTFGAWLKKIVIHTSIDLLKSVKVNFSDLDDTYLNVISDNHWEVEAQVSVEEVKLAICQLDQKYELVLSLFLIEGYDHQEISSILEISEVNSRTLLLRGKKKLKELLKQFSNGTGY